MFIFLGDDIISEFQSYILSAVISHREDNLDKLKWKFKLESFGLVDGWENKSKFFALSKNLTISVDIKDIN